MIDRRAFVTVLGASIVAGVAAQGTTRSVPRIGFLHPASAEDSTVYQRLAPGLAQLGYVDGKSIKLELRSAKGAPESVPKLIADLLAQKVDLLLVVGPAAVKAAAAATATMPIVAIDLESDPVEAGWMKSLSRPGGNVTGFFLDLPGMSAKWLQLLREAVPDLRDVSLLWDTSSGGARLAAARASAAQLGLRAQVVSIDNWSQFDDALDAAVRTRTRAFVVLSSPTAFQYSAQFAAFTLRHLMPAISPFRPFATAGGLMSYGPDLDLYFDRAASMIDRILRGAKPADVAVEQPVKYELVINQRTGQALGLPMPKSLLLRADEVIR